MKFLVFNTMQKAFAPVIARLPMTAADVNLASWDEFFLSGGQLNQPSWLQTGKFKKIKKQFEMLARYHSKS